MNRVEVETLKEEMEGKTPQELLAHVHKLFGSKVALSSSLGAEDQVLTDMLMKVSPEMGVFTLDTGRLFPETYDLIARTSSKYKSNRGVFPDKDLVEKMVKLKGINLFYESVENRKQCCHVRKIEPLKRAFAGLDAWVCGLRSAQAVTRSEVGMVEWDEVNQIVKLNPLVNWSEDDVWAYVKENNVPYNVLHDKEYPSIGCQPCTRAIMEGEDVRAGRWYWENPESKECGLHKR